MPEIKFTLTPLPGIDGGKKGRTIEISTEDGKDVITAYSLNDPSSPPSKAAVEVVEYIRQEAPDYVGIDDYRVGEEVPPSLLPPEGEDVDPASFLVEIQDKLNAFLTSSFESWHKEGKGVMTILWQERNLPGTVEIRRGIPLRQPTYEGEDWHEVGRLPEYEMNGLINRVKVLYSGQPHQTVIQLSKREVKKGKPAGYNIARVVFTGKDEGFHSFFMERRETCWGVCGLYSEDGVGEHILFLENSGYKEDELSYILEAHATYRVNMGDMPFRDAKGSDTISVCSGSFLLGDPAADPKKTDGRLITIENAADGYYTCRVTCDERDGRPKALILENERHIGEDKAGREPGEERTVFTECGVFGVYDPRPLGKKIGTKEEFVPFIIRMAKRRFHRAYRCNYLGYGYAVATLSPMGGITTITPIICKVGRDEGKVIGLICRL